MRYLCKMEDELDMETQLERELAAEQEELLEVEEEEDEDDDDNVKGEREDDGGVGDDDDVRERESILLTSDKIPVSRPGLAKVRSLPANFIYSPPQERNADGTFLVILLKTKIFICSEYDFTETANIQIQSSTGIKVF